MAKVTPITEQFQHFVRDLKESFRGTCRRKRGCRESSYGKRNYGGRGTAAWQRTVASGRARSDEGIATGIPCGTS